MQKGVKMSPEAKAKISASVKRAHAEGRLVSPSFLKPYKHTPESRAKISAAQRRITAEGRRKPIGISTRWTSEQAKELRRKQIQHEEAEAEKLRSQGYEVFSSTVVCDRIAIKDGQVYFIEFKRQGQLLRPGQQRLSEVAGKNFIVVYSEA